MEKNISAWRWFTTYSGCPNSLPSKLKFIPGNVVLFVLVVIFFRLDTQKRRAKEHGKEQENYEQLLLAELGAAHGHGHGETADQKDSRVRRTPAHGNGLTGGGEILKYISR